VHSWNQVSGGRHDTKLLAGSIYGGKRLHEKNGKEHDVPYHHNLDHFLDEYSTRPVSSET
jgi:hypothetical protein